MRITLISVAIFAAITGIANAERAVTEAERVKLEPAIVAQGCSGGKLAWDESDREFEVDDVRCNDGKKYDLKFNADFTLKSKKLDD